jgi:hypothetical protein
MRLGRFCFFLAGGQFIRPAIRTLTVRNFALSGVLEVNILMADFDNADAGYP